MNICRLLDRSANPRKGEVFRWDFFRLNEAKHRTPHDSKGHISGRAVGNGTGRAAVRPRVQFP